MKYLVWCLVLAACGSPTDPFYTPPECPDGFESWHWSYMDSSGVLTEKDLCWPEGIGSALIAGTTKDKPATGSITLIICLDGVCPTDTVATAPEPYGTRY